MVTSTGDVVATPPPPAQPELQRIRAGDQRSCRNLIDRWEPAIKTIASGYASRRSDLDDLMQVGRLAVYQSALNYDPAAGTPFGNYAKRAVKNAVLTETGRLARQRKYETPLEGNPEKGDAGQEGMADDADRAAPVREWVRELPEPHATIFRLLYVERVKQRVAAEAMGVTQPRVAQLHRSFLDHAQAAFAC